MNFLTYNISNLLFTEEEVGQHIKSSKKHLTWEFILLGIPHKIELFSSNWGEEKIVLHNGNTFFHTINEKDQNTKKILKLPAIFDIGNGHYTALIQSGEKFDLKIDNISFSQLYDMEKNKLFFAQQSSGGGGQPSFSPSNKRIKNNNAMVSQISNSQEVIKEDQANHGGMFHFCIKMNEHARDPKASLGFGGEKKEEKEEKEKQEIKKLSEGFSVKRHEIIKEKPSMNQKITKNDLVRNKTSQCDWYSKINNRNDNSNLLKRQYQHSQCGDLNLNQYNNLVAVHGISETSKNFVPKYRSPGYESIVASTRKEFRLGISPVIKEASATGKKVGWKKEIIEFSDLYS